MMRYYIVQTGDGSTHGTYADSESDARTKVQMKLLGALQRMAEELARVSDWTANVLVTTPVPESLGRWADDGGA